TRCGEEQTMAHALISDEMSHEEAANDRAMFGFWVYLMTDLLMFAVLFAVYAVLNGNTLGGPTGRELFSLPLALQETLILLTSSFTCGIGMIAARAGNKKQVLTWFGITFILGLAFLALEMKEFAELIHEGHTIATNAFFSSFFTLVGTHGLHITSGLLWMGIILIFVMRRGLNAHMVRKLAMLSLFWHFLDIVWIFIFTVVYLRAFV
ncbi:MAG TPA: cytochrome o ubiquinol oxidase subunit III, partial [Candidatus Limnocylindrales bacterium]|nr:cytochrome o ubiquinol oxidase subunit III [Candidatus Limnocylindrales bacterium]